MANPSASSSAKQVGRIGRPSSVSGKGTIARPGGATDLNK